MTNRAGLYGPEAFLETDGTPARLVPISVFDADGTTPSAVYTDAARTSTVTQPLLTDATGNLSFYAEPGIHVLAVRGTTLTVQIPVNPIDDVTVFPLLFSTPGVLTAGVGTSRLYLPENYTLLSVTLAVGTPPTGQPIIADINYDGVSIFTGIPTSRPQIPAGQNTGVSGPATTTQLATGHYLTCDRDQVGSGTPGSDLVAAILLQRRS